MTYANYSYYRAEYMGSLSEPLFNFYIVKASKIIDRNVNRKITQKDIDEDKEDNIKYVACELCDYLERYEKIEKKEITGYSIDGVSRNYKTINKQEHNKNIESILDGLPHELRRYL